MHDACCLKLEFIYLSTILNLRYGFIIQFNFDLYALSHFAGNSFGDWRPIWTVCLDWYFLILLLVL